MLRLDENEYRKLKGLKPKNKYNAKKVVSDGYCFDSKAERDYYEELKLRMRLGEVKYFLRQVPFHLPGNVKYIVDFEVFLQTGEVEYIDVKGFQTEIFKIKKKQVEALYPIKIKLVR